MKGILKMDFLNDWNFWLSIITAFIALVALYQSHYQVKLSNKQFLFDKRSETFEIANGLIQLFEKNAHLFEIQKERGAPILAIDTTFNLFTNNAYLENIAPAFMEPLKNPEHKDYLKKLEEMQLQAARIKFIFTGPEAIYLSNFVNAYEQLLREMYQYKIVILDVNRYSKGTQIAFAEACEIFKEPQSRDRLFKYYDNLKNSYNDIQLKAVLKKIQKQINL